MLDICFPCIRNTTAKQTELKDTGEQQRELKQKSVITPTKYSEIT